VTFNVLNFIRQIIINDRIVASSTPSGTDNIVFQIFLIFVFSLGLKFLHNSY
jgi:hypothetical protein